MMKMRLAAFRVMVITALLGISTTCDVELSSEAADRETQSRTPSEDAKVLNRIFANWNARSERARSVHLIFDYKLTMLKAAAGIALRNDSQQREVWLEGNDRIATLSTVPMDANAGTQRRKLWRWTDDGKVQSVTFFGTPKSNGDAFMARARIMSLGEEQRHLGPEAQPVWLAWRPMSPPLSFRPEQFHLVTENAVVDQSHYTKIERIVKEARYDRLESLWVDPVRDDLIVHWEMRPAPERRQNVWKGSISYKQDVEHRWVPSQWSTKSIGPIQALFECVALRCNINGAVPPGSFAPDVPPRSVVFDRLTNKYYVLEKSGEKRMLSQQEFNRLWESQTDSQK